MEAREKEFAGAAFWGTMIAVMIVSRFAIEGTLVRSAGQALTDVLLVFLGAFACRAAIRQDVLPGLLAVVWFTAVVVTGQLTDPYKDAMHLLWGAAAGYTATTFRLRSVASWSLIAGLVLALAVEVEMAFYDNGMFGGGFVVRHFLGDA